MPDKDSAIPTKWGGDSVRPPEEWPRVEGYQIGSALLSYVHLHFASNPAIAQAFVSACARRTA